MEAEAAAEALEWLGPLSRTRGDALALHRGKDGCGARPLPLPRAGAISTLEVTRVEAREAHGAPTCTMYLSYCMVNLLHDYHSSVTTCTHHWSRYTGSDAGCNYCIWVGQMQYIQSISATGLDAVDTHRACASKDDHQRT